MAQGQTNGTKAQDPEFYAGFSRFEIELEVSDNAALKVFKEHR